MIMVLVSDNAADKVMQAGPVDTDNPAALTAPPGTHWITRADAIAAGYTEPAELIQARNGATLRDRAAQALAANATFLGLGAPSNAQVLAQVQRLTRECSGIIRLLLGQLDTTDGT